MNPAQIEANAQAYLKYYNRVAQSLTLEAVGVPGIRAGSIIPVLIRDIQDLSFNRVLLVDKATHSYEGTYHSMTLDVKMFSQLGGES